MSTAKLLGIFMVIGVILIFALPSVNVNGKSQPQEQWTSAHERQMQAQCPPISPNELGRHKR